MLRMHAYKVGADILKDRKEKEKIKD